MKSTSMKIKQGIVFAALLGLPAIASAQNNENLVDNGGFESTTGKAKKLGQIDMATGWKSPTGSRADLFLTDSKMPEIGSPMNAYGKEAPKEGENYAGIVAFSFGDKVPRSYVMAKLKTPLKKDVKYCVSFYVSLAEGSKYASNQIGANISKKEFGTDQKSAIIDKTHILDENNKIFNAMYGWEKVCGTYVAEGGEKYITIGNFTANDDTKKENNKKPVDNDMKSVKQVIAAYYYIDDVVVTLITEDQPCDCGGDKDPNEVSATIYQKSIVLNDKMTPQQKIEAQGVYFAFGKDRLTQQAMAALDLVAAEMKAHGDLTITLNGHSDPAEDELAEKKPYYADMDKKRIAAVTAYLTEKGIAASRIKSSNKGSNEPNPEIVESDEADLKMAKNRRVQIVVN
jgi:outer membrane protein OmpA-like peptidoglycan-associated protein